MINKNPMQLELELMVPSAELQAQSYGVNNAWIREHMEKGCRCFACNQYVRVYRRTITAAMAHALILIYRYYQTHTYDSWLQLEGYFKRCNIGSTVRGDVPKLRYWGLIEKAGITINGRHGHYRLTSKGQRFINGAERVQQYAKIYNDEFYGFEGDTIGIEDCIENFSLEKILAAPEMQYA